MQETREASERRFADLSQGNVSLRQELRKCKAELASCEAEVARYKSLLSKIAVMISD